MTPAGFSGDASPMASPPLLRRGSRNILSEAPYQLGKRGVRQYECKNQIQQLTFKQNSSFAGFPILCIQ